jgi:hypothetical protein
VARWQGEPAPGPRPDAVANGWGGKRAGSGRPKGSPGLKSEALAGRLDELGCDPAEALVRLGNKAEAAGEIELAVKAFSALMPFRWPKLKESSLDLGLGLSGSLADRLNAAQARLSITVCSGIDRPPDDPGAIEAAPVPPPSPASASGSPNQIKPAAPPPKPRPAPSPQPSAVPPAPPLPVTPVSAHAYWSQPARPPSPDADYDPWEQT